MFFKLATTRLSSRAHSSSVYKSYKNHHEGRLGNNRDTPLPFRRSSSGNVDPESASSSDFRFFKKRKASGFLDEVS